MISLSFKGFHFELVWIDVLVLKFCFKFDFDKNISVNALKLNFSQHDWLWNAEFSLEQPLI